MAYPLELKSFPVAELSPAEIESAEDTLLIDIGGRSRKGYTMKEEWWQIGGRVYRRVAGGPIQLTPYLQCPIVIIKTEPPA